MLNKAELMMNTFFHNPGFTQIILKPCLCPSFPPEPNKVTNLIKTNVTETSVSLVWNKPAGNVDFYLVEVHGLQPHRELQSFPSDTESAEVLALTPGNLYTFTVFSRVQDKSNKSEESHIMAYTSESMTHAVLL